MVDSFLDLGDVLTQKWETPETSLNSVTHKL